MKPRLLFKFYVNLFRNPNVFNRFMVLIGLYCLVTLPMEFSRTYSTKSTSVFAVGRKPIVMCGSNEES
jgi:hypothetical protein